MALSHRLCTNALVPLLEDYSRGAWEVYEDTLTKLPVVKASCLEDLSGIFELAREKGFRIAPCGAGASFQQCRKTDIVWVKQRSVKPVWAECDRLQVASSTTWSEVARSAALRGRRVPVLTSYPHVSVGGTISFGGYGQSSIVWGSQAENVHSLEVLVPDGSIRICSREVNTDLFFAVLAGRGRIGIIGKVQLPTICRSGVHSLAVMEFDSLRELVQACIFSLNQTTKDVSYMKGQQQGGRARLLLAADGIGSLSPVWRERYGANEFIVRDWDLRCLDRMHVQPTVIRAWRDYVVDAQHALELCELIQHVTQKSAVFRATSGQLLVLVAANRSEPGPNLIPAIGRLCVGIGVYMDIPPDKVEWLEAARCLHDALLIGCLQLDGRPYLATGIDVAGVDEQVAFKEDWKRQELVRQRVDAHSLMWNY